MFPSASPRESRVSGKQNSLFPLGPVIKCLLTSFNIRENKRNVEWLLKQSLNAFKLIQHRLNFDSTCFNTIEGVGTNGLKIAVQQNRTDVEAVFPLVTLGLYLKRFWLS